MSQVIYLNRKRGKLILCNRNNYFGFKADEFYYVEAFHYDGIPYIQYMSELALDLDLKTFIEISMDYCDEIEKQKEVFKRRYLAKIKRKNAQRILKYLKKQLGQGKTMVLFCDETLEEFNHLKILGSLIKEEGYNVEFRMSYLKRVKHSTRIYGFR